MKWRNVFWYNNASLNNFCELFHTPSVLHSWQKAIFLGAQIGIFYNTALCLKAEFNPNCLPLQIIVDYFICYQDQLFL